MSDHRELEAGVARGLPLLFSSNMYVGRCVVCMECVVWMCVWYAHECVVWMYVWCV